MTNRDRGVAYEDQVVRTLAKLQCQLDPTQLSRDGGVDHQGTWHLPDLDLQVVTQCKHEQKPVSVQHMREFQGVLSLLPPGTVGIFASSSGYSLYAQRHFLRMQRPAILCTLYDECIHAFLLNDPAQSLLPKLSVGTMFIDQQHELPLFSMLPVLNLDLIEAVASKMRDSYMSHVLFLVVLVVFLRFVAASWRSGVAPFEVPVCPPINPNVLYRYGVSQMQGRRPYMEDRHTAHADLNGDPTQSFYGVFDGHGGDGAANYCVQAMCQNIIREPSLTKQPAEALKLGFLRTDQEVGDAHLPGRILYLQIANRKNAEDGSTAVVVLTRGDDLFVAHAGDSRAILVHSTGKVTVLTSDHKPNRPDERKRIHDLGGSVVFWGVWRVEGILAVSRAIGDRMLKPFVVAEPEVHEFRRTANDHFVIVASDGVWDTLTNEDAAQLVMKHDDPQVAARIIMEEAYARGSLDNICAMVIDLRECVA
ncbi:TPA: hypothetical protein N0F65_011869 [Lagenidium giganteum]|uniref:PPM-type phosphatase domain-containing protein n=1 Tax=Lagenidium giganteum TaxID=4803 RepID=A0AAV2YK70_9STRA|nr:TPA: hypothetical protein N0F65_011869 [Lagenidium giganteum]